uniref:Uncharacterized protein n=1 Tax=Zea mays TaxID=4577 RepID=B6TS43_MAIZE|nr:hypothetical protein [Zea mays]
MDPFPGHPSSPHAISSLAALADALLTNDRSRWSAIAIEDH